MDVIGLVIEKKRKTVSSATGVPALHIGLAVHISVHLLAMTEDGHDNARHLSLIDVAVGQIGDPMKATAVESKLLRCHCHKS
jgi:hypothetical protein